MVPGLRLRRGHDRVEVASFEFHRPAALLTNDVVAVLRRVVVAPLVPAPFCPSG